MTEEMSCRTECAVAGLDAGSSLESSHLHRLATPQMSLQLTLPDPKDYYYTSRLQQTGQHCSIHDRRIHMGALSSEKSMFARRRDTSMTHPASYRSPLASRSGSSRVLHVCTSEA